MGLRIRSLGHPMFYEAAPFKGQKGDIEMTEKRKIIATVISQKGECEVGHRVGDQVIFSVDGIEGKICIHALYSMISKIFALMFDAKFPWLKEGQKAMHACPDPKNPVTFELSVIDSAEKI